MILLNNLPNSPWTHVDHAMPPIGRQVLVAILCICDVPKDFTYGIAVLCKAGWGDECGDANNPPADGEQYIITHWTALPEFPEAPE